jgi:tRNA nucleotidyltransferase (CCA-adding enzyme)
MEKYLKRLPAEIKDLIRLASNISSKENMPAYLVGGFVRDLILGVRNLDLDIVVEGDGIKFAEDFATHLRVKLIRHRRFGTATISVKPHLKIDIATARKEFYPKPAYLPEVSSGSLRDDLLRRDFTINAMAINISSKDFGKLIDFFRGQVDLKNKKIRILHNLSFIDDPTRILRAIRFEARYNFRIEPNTLKFLKEAARLGMIEKVEPQRIRDDLILMLKEKQPLKELKRMKELAGFGFINLQLSVSKKTFTLLESVKKQISWFKKACPQRRHLDEWLIYFMALIDSLNINNTRAVCRKFAFRRGEEKRILSCKKTNRKFLSSLSKKEIKPSRVFAILEPLSYEAILLLKAKHKNLLIQKHIGDFFKIYSGMRIHISGDDLAQLGIVPGPQYKKFFLKLLNARLDGLIKTKEEELALIRKLVKSK